MKRRLLVFLILSSLVIALCGPYSAAHAAAMGKNNALRSATSYLDFMPFSYTGLMEQLEYEGYSHSEAVYAADNCGADWEEQAFLKAKNYLEIMAFSRERLIEQLLYEGFTQQEAQYGVAVAYGDLAVHGKESGNLQNTASIGKSNALKSAQNYLSFGAFSYKGLIEQLEYEQYSREDAVYAADNCGADWHEQAAKKAKEYLGIMSFSKTRLVEQLVYEGFTKEQATYGAKHNGY